MHFFGIKARRGNTNHSNWCTDATNGSQPANISSFIWRGSSSNKFLYGVLAVPAQRSGICVDFVANLVDKATKDRNFRRDTSNHTSNSSSGLRQNPVVSADGIGVTRDNLSSGFSQNFSAFASILSALQCQRSVIVIEPENANINKVLVKVSSAKAASFVIISLEIQAEQVCQDASIKRNSDAT